MRRASSRQARGALVVAVIAGGAGHAGFDHPRLGGALVAHRADGFSRRPDEDEAGLRGGLGEIGVLSEKAVTGVDRPGARRPGRLDDRGDRQIGLRGRGGADANGGVGEAHMRGVRVGVGIDGDGAEALGARGADDAAGDLAAVGDEQAGEARAHAFPFAQAGARFSTKAARPSRPSGPRRAAAKLRRRSRYRRRATRRGRRARAVWSRRWRRARNARPTSAEPQARRLRRSR